MALSGSEGTLLMNCKLYLGKARTELSDKGIKSLGELDQFKDVLLRVARVTPISLDKILVEVQDSVNTDRRRREDEKKKRAFETKQAEAGNLIAAKKRKMTTRTATTATIASSNNNTNKSSTQEDSELEKKTVASVKEAKDVVRDPPSSRTPSCSSSSDGTSPSERSASGIAEVMHQSTPPTSTGTLSATSRSPECHSERDNAQGDRQLNETVGTLATNTPGSRSIPSGPSSVSSISPTDPPRPSQIPSNSNAHTIHPISTHSSNTPQPTNPPSSAPSSNGKAEKTTSDVSVNFTHLSGTPARPAPLQDSVMVDAEPVSFIDKYPETAIFTDNKAMFRRLKIHFEKIIYPCFFKQSKLFRSRKQIKQVLELCGKLNFDKVQNDLLAFVVLRRQKPGSRAQIIDLGENAEPVEIFQAIKIAGVNEADAKLHRVYGQIRLVESIDRKVRSGYVPRTHEKVNHLPQAQLPTFYLDDMAYKMCMDNLRKIEKG